MKAFLTGVRALGFVLVGFALWYVFAYLARAVITCVPAACTLADVWHLPGPGLSGLRETTILVMGLLMALWVSNRLFFSEEAED